MTVIAVLETPLETYVENCLEGWLDCQDGSIVFKSSREDFFLCAMLMFMSTMSIVCYRLYIATADSHPLTQYLGASILAAVAVWALGRGVKNILVRKALEEIRDAMGLTHTGGAGPQPLARDEELTRN